MAPSRVFISYSHHGQQPALPFDSGYRVSDTGDQVLIRAETFMAILFKVDLGFLVDGFESGDTARWTNNVAAP